MATFQEFRTAYVEEMVKFREGSAPGPWKNTPEEKVEEMLQAILKGTNADWLKYNPAMQRAAKRIGITKSPKFREWIKANYVSEKERQT